MPSSDVRCAAKAAGPSPATHSPSDAPAASAASSPEPPPAAAARRAADMAAEPFSVEEVARAEGGGHRWRALGEPRLRSGGSREAQYSSSSDMSVPAIDTCTKSSET